MRKYTTRFAALFSFLILFNCLEPYQPPEIQGDVGLLVVDGFLNGTENSALVKLSYATTLSSDSPPVMETGAFVSIEEEGGNVFSLNESDPGNYTIDNLLVDENKRYRLSIRTSSGEDFFSEYIEILNTPEIDSVTWKPDDKGVNIFVNTHDPANKAEYYLWNYEETWEYNSSFYSTYKLVDGEAFQRSSNDQIYTCWTTTPSTEILVGSTTRLSEAIVRDFPITFVPGPTVKLSRRYSIDVRQRALSKEEYNFWTQLKKTTESLGGLFDALPTQVIGNMRGVSPEKPVLGYFSGGRLTSTRLFILVQQLPEVLLRQRVTALCQQTDLDTLGVEDLPTTPNYVLLVDPIYVQGVGIVAYTTSRAVCIDCKVHGGTTTRPPFW
jgi:hypothetical protein